MCGGDLVGKRTFARAAQHGAVGAASERATPIAADAAPTPLVRSADAACFLTSVAIYSFTMARVMNIRRRDACLFLATALALAYSQVTNSVRHAITTNTAIALAF